jgi:hypothetical protein
MDDKRELSFPAEAADKRFVTVGFRSPQPVVTMDHRQRETPGPGQAMEERQQRDRIRPARHRHDQMLTGDEQRLLTYRSNKLSQQCWSRGGPVCRPHDRRLGDYSTTGLSAEYAAS